MFAQQYVDGLDKQIEALENKATEAVNQALKELESNPENIEQIFETYYNIINKNIFGGGCLGPATAAANPNPFLNKLGKACDKYNKVIFSDELILSGLVIMALKAAQFLEINDFYIVADEEGKQSMIKVNSTQDYNDVIELLIYKEISLDSIVSLEIIEPYYEMFRCHFFYEKEKAILKVEGRSEFVNAVIT